MPQSAHGRAESVSSVRDAVRRFQDIQVRIIRDKAVIDHAVTLDTHNILSTILSPVHECVDLTCIIGLWRRRPAPH